MNYDDVVEMYKSGKLAMYFGSSAGVKMFQEMCIRDRCITIIRFPDFYRNTTEHRQRATVKGDKASLVAFYEVSDRFLQSVSYTHLSLMLRPEAFFLHLHQSPLQVQKGTVV